MSYINTTTPTRIWIGGKEYTEFLINGSCNDDSSLTNSVIKTSGSIKLGGVHNSPVVREFPLPIGSEIIVQCSLPGGLSVRHPRGTLYLINSTINYETQEVDLEVGCSLYLVSVYENSFRDRIKSLFNFIGANYDVFDVKDFSFSELSSVLEALGRVMWQDKNGRIQCAKAFGGAGFGSIFSNAKFTSYDDKTALSVESLSESSTLLDPSSLTITVDWDLPVYEEPDPEDQRDSDGDGIPDKDEDMDGDGVPDKDDDDMDGDGIINDLDDDADGNGIPDDEEESDAEKEAGRPLDQVIEDITFVKTRYTRLRPIGDCLFGYDGLKLKVSEEKVFSCGKFLNPEYITARSQTIEWLKNPDLCKRPVAEGEFFDNYDLYYAYEVKGKLVTDDAYFSDEVKRYQVADYLGPGNQLNYEKTFEEMSLWRFADAAIGQWFDNVSKEYDLAIEEANQKCQEMNEYAEIRDENNYYLKTRAEQACLTPKEKILMDKTWGFYDCLFAERNRQKDLIINYALEIYNIALWGLNFFEGRRGITNINERFVFFGEGGEIVKKVETTTLHTGAAKATSDLIRRAGEIYELNNEEEGAVVDTRKESQLGKYDFGPPLDVIIGGLPRDITFEAGGYSYAGWPSTFLKSEATDEYIFGRGIVTQRSTRVDYENPENNTVDIKTSTDNSLAASAEPRNDTGVTDDGRTVDDIDGDGVPNRLDPDMDGDGLANTIDDDIDGDGSPNESDPQPTNPAVEGLAVSACNIPTETKTVVYKTFGVNTEPTVGASWAGSFLPSPEEISMPIGFKPLIPEDMEPEEDMTEWSCNILTDDFIRVAKKNMITYERYINKYLAIAMSKRMMDNRGIRVVEKMRPEVFGYHPFMPITVVLSANRKVFMTRTSAATWAFDSTNAICSFDCYVTSK